MGGRCAQGLSPAGEIVAAEPSQSRPAPAGGPDRPARCGYRRDIFISPASAGRSASPSQCPLRLACDLKRLVDSVNYRAEVLRSILPTRAYKPDASEYLSIMDSCGIIVELTVGS